MTWYKPKTPFEVAPDWMSFRGKTKRLPDFPHLEDVQEAFVERLHPRNRLGRFVDKPDVLDVTATQSTGAAHGDLTFKYDDDIAKIHDASTAFRALIDMGLPASDLRLPDEVARDRGESSDYYWPAQQPDPDWYRQIVQAVRDAQRRYPVLKDGPRPFRGVIVAQPEDPGMETFRRAGDTTWAVTGPDPHANEIVGFGRADRNKHDPIYVTINPGAVALDAAMGGAGDLMPSSRTSIYGRMMHELGHAVSQSSGFLLGEADGEWGGPLKGRVPFQWGMPEIEMLSHTDLTLDDVAAMSKYGASNVAEAWAEIFSMLNTPGAMERVTDPTIKQHMLDARDTINRLWQTRHPGTGPLM